jgi:electron transport complex protein RnfC
MELKYFKKGGIHPHDSKYTADMPITNAHLPKQIRIPMNMHIGAPAKVLVKAGDKVEEGQLIGEAVGFISANIHASVSGTVIAVEKGDTLVAKGVDHVIIETGGSIRNWYDKKFDYSKTSPEKLLEMIKAAGIVGMGGATFPTHVKLSPPKEKPMDIFIVNGAECEPYLTIDHRTMLEKPDAIIEGVNIIKKILGVKRVMIGIEENKPDAIEALSKASEGDSSIEIYALRTRYPQGGEKQLIQALTGREVPSGGLPSDVGVLVQNVATIFAIYEAVVFQKPLIERGLTYTGEQIEKRGNYKVRIGSPVQALIDELGMPAEHGTVIAGGPMMGLELTDMQFPVTKGTSGIVVLPKKRDYAVNDFPCIRCARCQFVCPIGLEPWYLKTLVDKSLLEEAVERGLLDCIECGSCSFVCPSTIPLVAMFRFGKGFWRRKQAAAAKQAG